MTPPLGAGGSVTMGETLLRVDDLSVALSTGASMNVPVIDGVSFALRRGETLALVGESGCGKSMTALALMRLLPESAHVTGGAVVLSAESDTDGLPPRGMADAMACAAPATLLSASNSTDIDLFGLTEAQMRSVRGHRIAMIFQEPATSLNPVLTLGEQIGEVLRRSGRQDRAQERERVIELLEAVGIATPRRRIDEYPFQFSGGMRQRAMIAMALALEPDILIADEPTTALDVTIQAQVLELLADLQQRRGTAIVLITHDLGVVAQMADRVAVMYASQLVEVADCKSFFAAPRHPYSRKLIEAVPDLSRRAGGLAVIPGQVPVLGTTWQGCRFAERCDQQQGRCLSAPPVLSPHQTAYRSFSEARTAAAQVRCFYPLDTDSAGVDAPGTDPMVATTGRQTEAALAESILASAAPLLELLDLKVHFPIRRGLWRRTVGYVRAVDGVSLAIERGQTLALVGESGCGKTTVGKAILGLVDASAGRVRFDGTEPARFDRQSLRRYRRRVQIVFQDPFGSLDPRMQVSEILNEGLRAQSLGTDEAARDRRAAQVLDLVGLPRSAMTRYPHEFSGGQRQRLAIARALAVEPSLIVCDEPTSALDVSVQAQILNLLRQLQYELGVSFLFITHNLAAVEFIADRVAVMYLGRIVEQGAVDRVLTQPAHPYTRALLSAVPSIHRPAGRIRLQGEMPSPSQPPSGCHFHPRCAQAEPRCQRQVPAVINLANDHQAACLLLDPAQR